MSDLIIGRLKIPLDPLTGQFIVDVEICTNKGNCIYAKALIDTGANTSAFNKKLVDKLLLTDEDVKDYRSLLQRPELLKTKFTS